MLRRVSVLAGLVLTLAGSTLAPAAAQPAASPASPPAALIGALKQGGYVVIMRHAASPQAPPTVEMANKDNPNRQRQLDETGRRSAVAMGAAIKAKAIPVGAVWSSPTYRALETARLAGFADAKTAAELGEGGANMQAASQAAAAWLRAQAATAPAPGSNNFLITHFPNIRAAFPDQSAALGDGEALIFRPDGSGEPKFLGRVPITAWAD